MLNPKSFAIHAVKRTINLYHNVNLRKKYSQALQIHFKKSDESSFPDLGVDFKREAEDFWKTYGITISSTDWHRYYYTKTGIFDPRFVPDDVFHRIIRPKLNDINLAAAWSDKAFTDWVVRDVKTVRSIVRSVNGRLLNENYELIDSVRANRIMNKYEALVLKPTMYTDTGKNVLLEHAPFNIKEIMRRYGKYFVVQIPFKQHPEMATLNESSVNTIRIDSILLDNEAHAVAPFVKVGQPGEFTDNGGGEKRIFIGIRDGCYTDFAYDHDCNKFYSLPNGYSFAGHRLTFLKEMCQAAERAHTHIPHFGLAFWDMSVDENGEPVIVEMNLRYPDSYVPQVGGGPFFGEFTEDLLSYLRKVY